MFLLTFLLQIFLQLFACRIPKLLGDLPLAAVICSGLNCYVWMPVYMFDLNVMCV